ncbi:MAG: ParB/RepB/Spo0J family partition protein [Erysipelotrichaceae bacterium]|jgi:ParB family chromosome partitioning protein|uniref:ParB/RepB/Spo0J family partition protein n=1 Tax=Grylomicrobium aquisgranensis TaxID=2926318 RepID=A0AB35U053_9FIRM|nr:ParB/RepB/Spo0J family partition protein [Lactimicrobium massiliense]MCH4021391.1 ParB/RepB/Spo0J family partition protein [Erysipelotrichaceae bacterium]MCI1325897.1 ParB/RepB/Spo0J family partition protein [Solobacterium sp.]MDX8418790.1 ParB/RepB/Spo0J family partition protein [Stecheria sp. CLA-KB-P133]MCH4043608.1 ParB/RepB/Spo0J family partition protein [Erysipelotrichaceae bacterium]MCH4120828.1 ParB/RepB/Spo0J family partition protein [Erysipelotrichaceae bacterium]
MRTKGRKGILDIFDRQSEQTIKQIPVEQIAASRYQPRLKFDEEALQELAQSIKEQGLIQPITVRQVEDHYEIIAGERRFRACQMAGYDTVPCYLLTPSEDQAAQMALVENIQRRDLSAIEEAKSYVQIMRQASLTQEQMAERVGKSQSAIANKIRLLNLPQEIQEGVLDQKISERHARALLSAPAEKQKQIYHEILKHGLTVRETEDYIRKASQPEKVHKRQKTKGFTRQTQLAINSVNQCVQMIRKMGIDAEVQQMETDNDIRMVVRFPKN